MPGVIETPGAPAVPWLFCSARTQTTASSRGREVGPATYTYTSLHQIGIIQALQMELDQTMTVPGVAIPAGPLYAAYGTAPAKNWPAMRDFQPHGTNLNTLDP